MPDWVSTLTTLPLTELVPSAGYGPLVSVAATVQPPEAWVLDDEAAPLDDAEALAELDEPDDEAVEGLAPPLPQAANTPPAPAPASRTSVRRLAIMRFKSAARLGASG
jgi:hypothetical protein